MVNLTNNMIKNIQKLISSLHHIYVINTIIKSQSNLTPEKNDSLAEHSGVRLYDNQDNLTCMSTMILIMGVPNAFSC